MMIFENRHQAGKLLAEKLNAYRELPHTIVLGLPRGGVVLAYEIAVYLHLPLDLVSPRKIGAPHNPELAIGAITETGEGIFDQRLISLLAVSKEYIARTVEQEKNRAQQRLVLYRKGLPNRSLKDKTVILVDDGVATGATMKAAIRSAKSEGAKRVIVAIPVSSEKTLEEIRLMVDEVVCLSIPPLFEAVGQFYEEFDQTEDEEVIRLMADAYRKKKLGISQIQD